VLRCQEGQAARPTANVQDALGVPGCWRNGLKDPTVKSASLSFESS